MRISHKSYKAGAQRLKKRFLWLPLTLGDETRWLEKAMVLQEYVEAMGVDMDGGPCPLQYWRDVSFWPVAPNYRRAE